MTLRKHTAILFHGFVVVAPILITGYAVVKALSWLDTTVRDGLQHLGSRPLPGLGVAFGVCAIYLVGLLARNWFFATFIKLSEGLLERIPLVKTVYSAIRDLLQFIGGARQDGSVKPAVLRSQDGSVALLGLITQEQPGTFLPGAEDRVAVYVPMSYQLGGFTVYVSRRAVEELKGMSVEDLLKISLTAGVSSAEAVEPDQKEADPSK